MRRRRGPRPTSVGAVIEIIERGAITDPTMGSGIVVPNEIRINGVPLLAPADDPVKIHEIDLRDKHAACVTLTLFARRVIVGTEDDVKAQPPLYGQGFFFAEADTAHPEHPVVIERRLALDAPKGVAVERHGITVEQAERLIAELQAAVAAARSADNA